MTVPTLVLQEAFTTGIAADVPAWETIASSYAPGVGGLRSFDASQGKTSDLDRDAAGTATFVVDVRDRALDPSNTAGAHYPYVTPNNEIRLAFGYVAEVLKDNPRSYWRLSEPDEALYARDDQRASVGTGVNSPTSGVVGVLTGDRAWSFASASSEYIDTGDLSLFEAGDCTYEAWVKTSSATDQAVFCEGATGTSNGESLLYVTSGGKLQAYIINNAGTVFTATSAASVNTGAFRHVVMTKAGTAIKLYVDGVADGTTTVSGSFTQNLSRIGRELNSGTYMNGTVDEVAVYASALSAARVLAHYAAGAKAIGGYVHSGYTDAHNISYTKPNDAIVTIPATDRFKLLARAKLTGFAERPEERASLRLIYTLGQLGYDFRYYVNTASSILMVENIADQYALDAILDMVDTENGRCFIDKDGTLVFISRDAINNNLFYNTSQATFTDTGAANGIPYTDIVFENSDTLLRNSVEIDHPTFDPIIVTDATSIAAHGTITYNRTVRDATAAAQNATAEAILAAYKDPQTRVLSVTVPTSRATASYPYGLYGKVLSLALGMRVTVVRTPPGGGVAITQVCHILSAAQSCDAGGAWFTTFGFTLAADVESYAKFDVGRFDVDTFGY